MIAYLVGGPCDLTKIAIPDDRTHRDYLEMPVRKQQPAYLWGTYRYEEATANLTYTTVRYRRCFALQSMRDTVIFEHVG